MHFCQSCTQHIAALLLSSTMETQATGTLSVLGYSSSCIQTRKTLFSPNLIPWVPHWGSPNLVMANHRRKGAGTKGFNNMHHAACLTKADFSATVSKFSEKCAALLEPFDFRRQKALYFSLPPWVCSWIRDGILLEPFDFDFQRPQTPYFSLRLYSWTWDRTFEPPLKMKWRKSMWTLTL